MTSTTVTLVWDNPVQMEHNPFSLDGELKGCREVGQSRTLSPKAEEIATEACDPNAWFSRGEGMDDTTVESDDHNKELRGWVEKDMDGNIVQAFGRTVALGRWEHLKDAHIGTQRDLSRQVSLPVGNFNPVYSVMASRKRERETRFQKAMNWLESAPLPQILKRRFGYAKNQRNQALASSLGFSKVPQGKWPGVRWDHKANAMVRHYQDGGVEVTRVAQLWDVPWTKEQATTLDQAIAAKVEEKLGK
jgi:hypothetical protein